MVDFLSHFAVTDSVFPFFFFFLRFVKQHDNISSVLALKECQVHTDIVRFFYPLCSRLLWFSMAPLIFAKGVTLSEPFQLIHGELWKSPNILSFFPAWQTYLSNFGSSLFIRIIITSDWLGRSVSKANIPTKAESRQRVRLLFSQTAAVCFQLPDLPTSASTMCSRNKADNHLSVLMNRFTEVNVKACLICGGTMLSICA